MRTLMIGDIYGNDAPLYYPDDKDYTVYDTDWHTEVGLCGELKFNVPRNNPKYAELEEYKVITLLKDGKEEWRGFIKSITENSDKQSVNVYCLEDLAWMNLEIAPVQQSVNRATKLQQVISEYNAMNGVAGTVKTFEAGYVINNGDGIWQADYETKMLGALRGLAGDQQYVRVRRQYVNNVLHRYVDFVTLPHFGTTSNQKIEFGENLRDFIKELNTSWMLNVINPYGDEIEGEEIYEGLTKRLAGTQLTNSESIAKYGRIEKNIIFNTSNLSTLYSMAADYLNQNKDPRLTLELTAVDLSQAGYDTDSYSLGDKVPVIAEPYGIDQYVYITDLEIDIQDLGRNVLTLSSTVTTGRTLTEQTAAITEEITRKIPDASSILKAAMDNAIALLNGAEGGYINTIFDSNNRPQQLWITNSIDPANATCKWVFNQNGLGYMYWQNGRWYTNLALTMNGEIVAEMIKTGTIDAERIKASVITAINGQNLKIMAKNLDISGAVTFSDFSSNLQTYVQNKADLSDLAGYAELSDLDAYADKTGLINGTTTINGACMKTGQITSNNYSESSSSSTFSNAGTKINLIDGLIKSKNFRIDNNGGQFGMLMLDSVNNKLYTHGYRDIYVEEQSGRMKRVQRYIYFNPKGDGWTNSAQVNIYFNCYDTGSHSTMVCRFDLQEWNGEKWVTSEYRRYNCNGDEMSGKDDYFTPWFRPTDSTTYRIKISATRKSYIEDMSIELWLDGMDILQISEKENVGTFRGPISGSANLYSLTVGGLSATDWDDKVRLEDDTVLVLGDDSSTSNTYITQTYSDISKRQSGSTVGVMWDTSSDRRLKENIKGLPRELAHAIIDGTDPVSFKYKNKDGYHYGMIAQDVRKLLDALGETDACLERSTGLPDKETGIADQRTINYFEYIPVLISYVKDLQAEVNSLKNINNERSSNG